MFVAEVVCVVHALMVTGKGSRCCYTAGAASNTSAGNRCCHMLQRLHRSRPVAAKGLSDSLPPYCPNDSDASSSDTAGPEWPCLWGAAVQRGVLGQARHAPMPQLVSCSLAHMGMAASGVVAMQRGSETFTLMTAAACSGLAACNPGSML